MRRFDYSFLDKGMLPAKLVRLTSSVASLKTMAGSGGGIRARFYRA